MFLQLLNVFNRCLDAIDDAVEHYFSHKLLTPPVVVNCSIAENYSQEQQVSVAELMLSRTIVGLAVIYFINHSHLIFQFSSMGCCGYDSRRKDY